MAFIQLNTYSQALGLSVGVNVLLPEGRERAQQRALPVVWLLHGYSDDHTIWMRRTSIERYRETLAPDFAVVMPAVDLSFYSDMRDGNRYWTYISEELPTLLGSLFPLSPRREDNFAAGLSMGGYGAVKLAFAKRDRFAACASLSGALDAVAVAQARDMDPHFAAQMRRVFGLPQEVQGSQGDLFELLAQAKAEGNAPALYACCGTQDFLWEDNLRFLGHARALGLDIRWEQDEGFAHTWDYWDLKIQDALKWFVAIRAGA